jgi:ABC-type nitrate/sulfonate/bicarbonate transport system permease component
MSALATDPTTSQPQDTAAGSGRSVVGRRIVTAVVTVVVALVVLVAIWALLLRVFDVSTFVGKTPLDVWNYLFSSDPPKGVRPASLTAEEARADALSALGTTLVDAMIGFVAGMVAAIVIAVGFVLFQPFEFTFMPIALLLRSVPLVAMAPVLLLMFGQGNLGIAVIAAIVVLFPALVNIVLGLRGAPPQAIDVIRVNGGSSVTELIKVRIPSALPQFFASVRISVPGAIVGAMLAEWLVGFDGMGGVLSGYKGSGNYGGVWTIVVLAVMSSIVLYAIATIVEAAVLTQWGPNAGKQ